MQNGFKDHTKKKEMIKPVKNLTSISKETEELIAIIAKSITTAKNNKDRN